MQEQSLRQQAADILGMEPSELTDDEAEQAIRSLSVRAKDIKWSPASKNN